MQRTPQPLIDLNGLSAPLLTELLRAESTDRIEERIAVAGSVIARRANREAKNQPFQLSDKALLAESIRAMRLTGSGTAAAAAAISLVAARYPRAIVVAHQTSPGEPVNGRYLDVLSRAIDVLNGLYHEALGSAVPAVVRMIVGNHAFSSAKDVLRGRADSQEKRVTAIAIAILSARVEEILALVSRSSPSLGQAASDSLPTARELRVAALYAEKMQSRTRAIDSLAEDFDWTAIHGTMIRALDVLGEKP